MLTDVILFEGEEMLSDREIMLECYKTERVAMQMANQRREMQGESPAYGEDDFLALEKRIESLLEEPDQV